MASGPALAGTTISVTEESGGTFIARSAFGRNRRESGSGNLAAVVGRAGRFIDHHGQ